MKLSDFFKKNPKVAIAFSGGVDSAYLLYAASRYASDIGVYYVKSPFQPEFELKDCLSIASGLNIPVNIIELDILSDNNIITNPSNRCYYCKRKMFEAITKKAHCDGFSIILDGTNASDLDTERPGMTALKELSILSPLKLCELTKEDIRHLSKQAGLFTATKPAYACLATRIPCGQRITKEALAITEKSENYLTSLGFTDFRIRMNGQTAIIQIKPEQMNMIFTHREEIVSTLKQYYDKVLLDMEGR